MKYPKTRININFRIRNIIEHGNSVVEMVNEITKLIANNYRRRVK